ncbi:MAG: ABC transporter ATP-binding protein [Bacteroidetes bacterium GWF2_42_66]|nr:MAG: ABC transporter ATP-binding protein [Bacteroidetes bacterium GWA2_42_15]OFY02472.1 MAG: ABC transporter ATP-binding protein [Bacteroidetes bacterium GWE2_42_39]OFY41429.1 MAG: ABC transporter ATP-binding protein [Bacteroidetes bacterium GWF2_42_66]HBL75363.1 ABC transporter ATP-binding protein [Prolixibacteraceae bacterium]HCR90282.1 ABC transporter ATP-binding protein [Prolixibacteraceae bacterium]
MLKIENITKTFNPGTANEVKAIRGVSIQIEEGSFVCVLGTNGSGKSTTLNAVAGTFLVDEGKISLDGVDITKWDEHKRAKYIGRVFQNPFSGTAPNMSIQENLALAMKRGMKRGLGWGLSKHLLDDFKRMVRPLNMGLEDRLENPIGKLSGGQRQALTLLMATALKPKLLLLDEHTAALDPKTASKVIDLTQQVISRDQLTTLMVTHSMQQAVNLGDRIIMMHQGKVAYDFRGEDKKRLKVNDLLSLFDELRRKDNIDPAVAAMLEAGYV